MWSLRPHLVAPRDRWTSVGTLDVRVPITVPERHRRCQGTLRCAHGGFDGRARSERGRRRGRGPSGRRGPGRPSSGRWLGSGGARRPDGDRLGLLRDGALGRPPARWPPRVARRNVAAAPHPAPACDPRDVAGRALDRGRRTRWGPIVRPGGRARRAVAVRRAGRAMDLGRTGPFAAGSPRRGGGPGDAGDRRLAPVVRAAVGAG